MPVDRSRAWLTPHGYERARMELVRLRAERATASGQETADAERRERRIRKLSELLLSVTVGHAPPDDGVAEPGMLVRVRYEIDGLTDQFLMADHEEPVDGDHWTCSPQSPLGAALHGAHVGERRRFRLPTGEMTAVTLISAAPYRAARTGMG